MATREVTHFGGFPRALFEFLAGLEKDNSKSYWDANKATWETAVQEPVQSLMAELEPEFGPLRTFRPNRDVRFSKDKSPYKTWVGVTTSERSVGGIGCFLRLEAGSMRLACGSMVMATDQLERFRAGIDNVASGAEFVKLSGRLADKGLLVGPGRQDPLKRTPAGYPKDHPREEILRWKGAVVVKEYEQAAWMYKAGAVEKIREVWSGAVPLTKWIEKYVGESTIPVRRRGD
ncbi:DUF2461 domain-containing protein [Kribbella sp. NBC_01245]|uniref:DUF2461 domain-containing protein n=1 Tax=Kribbella sp. NBC_01245 TaxID=2903578 RepID=UPI002E2C32D6|nr:DUF2461 domain-containing protein [Kribbella sp. NBC_01245]